MKEPLSGRDSYRDELTKLAASNSKILCLESDLGGSHHAFAVKFPDRYFNFGIAELASVDIAAGLAEAGFIPFYSTFAGFAALRAAEAMKLAQGYMAKNIKIVCPYGGLAGAYFGGTHHCLEDLAVAQSFAGLKIAAPFGEEETRAVIRQCVDDPRPYYIRLGRSGRYDSLTSNTKVSGKPICLVSVGEQGTRLCAEFMNSWPEMVDHRHLIYLDIEALKSEMPTICKAHKKIVVVEEARPQGSIASTIALYFGQSCQVFGFNCGLSWLHTGGTHEQCLEKVGFSINRLRALIDDLIQ